MDMDMDMDKYIHVGSMDMVAGMGGVDVSGSGFWNASDAAG